MTQVFDHLDHVVEARQATPLATVTRTRYEAAGKPVHVSTDWTGRLGESYGHVVRRFAYDEEHRVRQEWQGGEDPSGHHRVAHKYNPAGLRSVTIAANNTATLWKYDSRDQVARVIRGAGVGESIEEFVRDGDGRLLEHRSPEGRITRSAYDALGRVVAVTDALGNVTRTSYDAASRPTVVRQFERVIDAIGAETFVLLARLETVYDELGRAVRGIASKFEAPPPAVTAAEVAGAYADAVVGTPVETQTFYDAAGRVVRVVDALGNAASSVYDAAGRVVEVTDPTGNRVETTYDLHGNVVRVDRIDLVRDGSGAVTGQEVFTTLATYDERDRKVSDTDALGNETTYGYDSLDRLVWSRDALGNEREQVYDVYGNLVEVRTQRTTTGDGSGQLLAPHVVRQEYDEAGLVTARVDTLGRRTEFRYDKWDRLVEQVMPDGARLATVYDRDSLPTGMRDAHGVVVRTTYDGLGRAVRTVVDTAEVDAGVTIEGVRTVERAYDGLGRAVRASNEVCAVAATYDSLGRALAEATTLAATGQLLTVGRRFDDAGRMTELTYPGGRQVAHDHDAAGRVTELRHVVDGVGFPGAAGGARSIATYTYAGGRVRAVTFGNGTIAAYAHDARGGVVEVKHRGPSGNLVRMQQLRDAVRTPRLRYQELEAAKRAERLGYDSRYQLGARQDVNPLAFDVATVAPATTVPAGGPAPKQALLDAAIGTRLGPTAPTGADGWQYDLTGNRTVATATTGAQVAYGAPDARDRYPSVGGVAYAYDAAGNLTSDGVHRYVYDGFRRLVRIVKISTGATVARYDYDPSGRRVVEDRPASGGAVVIAYDGVDRVADFRSGACVGQYVHGPMVDDPVEVAAAGRQHTYHLDLQGSVRALTNAAGALVAQFRFDPFGVTLNAVGATIAPPGSGGVGATEATQPFGYAGRPYDAAVAQYDYRARVYVPALGRFLQRDPAGPVDGHLYAYAGNAPLAFGDPSGLCRKVRVDGFDFTDSDGNGEIDLNEARGSLAALNDAVEEGRLRRHIGGNLDRPKGLTHEAFRWLFDHKQQHLDIEEATVGIDASGKGTTAQRERARVQQYVAVNMAAVTSGPFGAALAATGLPELGIAVEGMLMSSGGTYARWAKQKPAPAPSSGSGVIPRAQARGRRQAPSLYVYRYASADDRERLDAGEDLRPKGTSRDIASHVSGRPTSHISAGLSRGAIEKFDSGNGLLRIDVNKAVEGGARYIDHGNVVQAVGRAGNPTVERYARDATEVLFRGLIPISAIERIR
ncbi:MAG: hypothetical protein IPL61_19690 [Myxococcales bacterium]|nr:hypothetical protein [Myxococcales bacterium]